MFALLTSSTELKRLLKGTLPKLGLIAIMLLPLAYGALYLWAFKNPPSHLNRVAIALVNQDETTTQDGKSVSAGDDLVDKLNDSNTFKWQHVSEQTAVAGVRHGTYYFAVTIPKNFSHSVTSVRTSSPKAAKLDVTFNDTNSFLAGTLGKSALKEIRTAVAQSTSDTIAKSMLVGLNDASDGFTKAANGSNKLHKGSADAKSGSQQLVTGLDTLANGMVKLDKGSGTLASGTKSAATGASSVASGAKSLKNGTKTLQQGARKTATGATALATNLNTASQSTKQLAAGSATLASGSSALKDGLNQLYGTLANGSGSVATSAAKIADGTQQIADEATKAKAIVNQLKPIVSEICPQDSTQTETSKQSALCAQLNKKLSELNDKYNSIQTLNTGAHQLSAGIGSNDSTSTSTVVGAVRSLSKGATSLSAGAAKLNHGVQQLNSGTQQLSAGANKLASGNNALAKGTSKLTSGTSKLASGATSLSTGTNKLAAGAAQLHHGIVDARPGVSKLESGSLQLDNGLRSIATGTRKLTNSLKDGASQTNVGSPSLVNKKAHVASNPVALSNQYINKAANFGVGFAPFFLSLAMYFGALVTWMLLHPIPVRALATPTPGWRIAFSGFLSGAVIGLAQAVVLFFVVHDLVGIPIKHPFETLAFMVLVSFANLAFLQLLNVWLGAPVARVIAMILLMVQLTSSGGTYPIETSPTFFRIVHPFMPMSYAVTGLRGFVTGGLDDRVLNASIVLTGLLVISLVVTSVLASRQRVFTMKRLHPSLTI